MFLEDRAGDADGVLLETVEQAADQNQGDDLFVGAGDADLGEG